MTRDEIISLAQAAGYPYHGLRWNDEELAFLARFAALAKADEREACAQHLQKQNTAMTDKLAAEIRARGQA